MTSTDTSQERSGRWLRVSTKNQDEANQRPDLVRWEADHGYANSAEFEVHGGSAFKRGNRKFDAAWAEVLEAFRTGRITVLVVWRLDRLDRKLEALKMLGEVSALGGRVEFVKEPVLNDLTTIGGKVSLVIAEHMAHEESMIKSERVKIAHAARRETGALTGRYAFGFVSVERSDGYKALEVTPEGAEIIPQIFQRVAAGSSLMKVARWLDAEGIKPMSEFDRNGKPVTNWSPQSVRGIIRNTIYRGEAKAIERTEVKNDDGSVKVIERRSKGGALMDVEAIVNETLWRDANARLSQAKKGIRPTKSHAPALMTSALFCGNCHAPAYRIFSGNGAKRSAFYRCAGHLPQRKGCGVMVPLAELDTMVDEMMQANQTTIIERRFVAGDDEAIQEKLTVIERELQELPTRGLSDDDEDAERASLRSEKRSLQDALSNAQPSRYEDIAVLDEAGNEITFAARWNEADFEEKRSIIKSQRFTVNRTEEKRVIVGMVPREFALAA